jgi:hypothetical protein
MTTKEALTENEGEVQLTSLYYRLIFILNRGAWYQTGDNLIVVWAKFSTLSSVILLVYCTISARQDMQPFLELKHRPGFVQSAKVCP